MIKKNFKEKKIQKLEERELKEKNGKHQKKNKEKVGDKVETFNVMHVRNRNIGKKKKLFHNFHQGSM